jgi:hypothetical protein
MWLAVGTTIAFSSDGIVWQQGSNPFPNGSMWESVAWNGTMWIGAAKGLVYSYDGIYWTKVVSSNALFNDTYCTTVTWNGSLWIAGGESQPVIAYSLNGKTWFPSPNITPLLTKCHTIQSRNLSLIPPTSTIKSIIVNPQMIDCALFQNVRLDLSGTNTIKIINVSDKKLCAMSLFIYTDITAEIPTLVSLKYNGNVVSSHILINNSPTLINITSGDGGQNWIVEIKS